MCSIRLKYKMHRDRCGEKYWRSLSTSTSKTMAFRFLVLLAALSSTVFALNIKRVACPDGVNTASHEAVSFPDWILNDSDRE